MFGGHFGVGQMSLKTINYVFIECVDPENIPFDTNLTTVAQPWAQL